MLKTTLINSDDTVLEKPLFLHLIPSTEDTNLIFSVSIIREKGNKSRKERDYDVKEVKEYFVNKTKTLLELKMDLEQVHSFIVSYFYEDSSNNENNSDEKEEFFGIYSEDGVYSNSKISMKYENFDIQFIDNFPYFYILLEHKEFSRIPKIFGV